MKYFVWINTTVGVQGQIWHNEPLSGEGQKSQQPIFIKKLQSDDPADLHGLMIKYWGERSNGQPSS